MRGIADRFQTAREFRVRVPVPGSGRPPSDEPSRIHPISFKSKVGELMQQLELVFLVDIVERRILLKEWISCFQSRPHFQRILARLAAMSSNISVKLGLCVTVGVMTSPLTRGR